MNVTKTITIYYKDQNLYTIACTKEKLDIDESKDKDIDKSGTPPSIALLLGKAIGVLISEVQTKNPFSTMTDLYHSLKNMIPELDIQYAEATQYPPEEFKKELKKLNTEPPYIDPKNVKPYLVSQERQPFTKKQLKTIEKLESKLLYADPSFTDRVCGDQSFTEYLNKIMAILDSYTS